MSKAKPKMGLNSVYEPTVAAERNSAMGRGVAKNRSGGNGERVKGAVGEGRTPPRAPSSRHGCHKP